MNRMSQNCSWPSETTRREGYVARAIVNASAHLPFGLDPAAPPGH